MAALQTLILNMDQIVADPAFNVRSKIGKKGEEEYQGIPELAADIKKSGQLVPVMVRTPGKDGKYSLIAGFRRHAAIALNKGETILATIMETDEVGAAIMNAKENVIRDGISSYDFAKRCVELRDRFKLTQANIAREFAAGTKMEGQGLSRSYIGNLMSCIDKLQPDILNAWKNGTAPALTTLISWAALERDEQVHAWQEHLGLSTDEESGEGEEGEGEGGDKKKKPRKATEGNLIAAIRAVKSDAKLSETVKDALLAALGFAYGKTKTLKVGQRVVFDPKALKTNKPRTTRSEEAEAE